MTARSALALQKRQAARACGLTVAEFERHVADRRLPAPRVLGETLLWSMTELEDAILALPKAGESADPLLERARSRQWDRSTSPAT